MKFSIFALTTLVSTISLAAAAPTPDSTETGKYVVSDYLVPDEAINNKVEITDDQQPLVVEESGKKYVLIVNATLAESVISKAGIDIEGLEAAFAKSDDTASVSKRDANADAEAKFHWMTYRFFQPNLRKREANADAKFHWMTYRFFQPNLKKREANADAEAKFHWMTYRFFQPNLKKREANAEANADAKFHWMTYRFFQPNLKKREANADAEAKFHWMTYRFFQPNL
ncbi:DEHA2F19580p [Debaryomyces hansenii CBS767]|uniref:DEHA2F19580p n=1 Tax=Debaryomyces hansenii (strain ATCC 36239 / CBS 767 / BCRC 21394 / JCM 1990 / NBRC 0083 / IGC 2968) TaxID=284592 RepID=Q6BKS3_DEBHA|nr:DEHA2F19580p [Debaryomyces hansenii CBS767]CAG89586.2 DEHA2F19580p [Debaryomyces hansenii CBS767]|eukprot:XP_461198.2 DEHA2F19580p [Debaryomyces hansenii CBS767]